MILVSMTVNAKTDKSTRIGVKENSGTTGGFDTTPGNSESAKLFPFRFSNAMVIGPVYCAGIGTLTVLEVPSLFVFPLI